MIGHLGAEPLAALALAGTVLTTVVRLWVFLAYGTTAHIARLAGGEAGGSRAARDRQRPTAAQAMWLGLAVGLVALAAIQLLAGPAVALVGGGEGAIEADAERFLRVAAIGVPRSSSAWPCRGHARPRGPRDAAASSSPATRPTPP